MFARCLLLAAAAASIAAPAVAAQARLRTDDIDLNTPAGVERLQNRIASTARRECAGEEGTGSRTNGGSARCERQVRAALIRSLPAETRARIEPAAGQTATPAQ